MPTNDHHPVTVHLVSVDASNWRELADIDPLPEQAEFVAPITRYLCLAHYGGEWQPLAIEHNGAIVGHVMWAVDEDDGSTWIGGLVIDAEHQGRGMGRATMVALAERFTIDGTTDLALSYSPRNQRARDLYLALDFVETGEMADEEIVARLRRG